MGCFDCDNCCLHCCDAAKRRIFNYHRQVERNRQIRRRTLHFTYFNHFADVSKMIIIRRVVPTARNAI